MSRRGDMLFLFRIFLFLLNFAINFSILFSGFYALSRYSDVLDVIPINWDLTEIAVISVVLLLPGFLYTISPLFAWFMHLSEPVRKLSLREKERLMPLLDELMAAYKYKKMYEVKKVSLYIMDDVDANAQAYGRNKIALTSGLLNSIKDDDVIKSIMAHELGHLHYKDTIYRTYVYGWSTFLNFIILNTCRMLNFVGMFINIIPFGFIVSLPLFMGSTALLWILELKDLPINLFLKLEIFLSGAAEYRADKFAADLVGSEALLKFFEKIRIGERRTVSGFFISQRQSHPATELRIDRLFGYNDKDIKDMKSSSEYEYIKKIDLNITKGTINFNK